MIKARQMEMARHFGQHFFQEQGAEIHAHVQAPITVHTGVGSVQTPKCRPLVLFELHWDIQNTHSRDALVNRVNGI